MAERPVPSQHESEIFIHYPIEHDPRERRSNIAVLTSGQDAQKIGMFKEVLEYPAGREVLERGNKILIEEFGFDILALADEGADPEALKETQHTQPAVFLLNVALHNVNKHHKHKDGYATLPQVIAGNSMGEVTAAFLSGAMDFETAVRFIGERGRIMKEEGFETEENGDQIQTAMNAFLTTDRVFIDKLISQHPGLEVCIINPKNLVVGGPKGTLDKATEAAKQAKTRAREVFTDRAMHHSSLKNAQASFDSLVDRTKMGDPFIPVVMAKTGEPVTTAEKIKEGLKFSFSNPVDNARIIHYIHEEEKIGRISEINEKGIFGKAIEDIYEAVASHKVIAAVTAAGIVTATGVGVYEVVTRWNPFHPQKK